jgi:hypothetical protein
MKTGRKFGAMILPRFQGETGCTEVLQLWTRCTPTDSDGRNADEWRVGKDLEGNNRSTIKVLSHHSPEETDGKPRKLVRIADAWISNQGPREYKSNALSTDKVWSSVTNCVSGARACVCVCACSLTIRSTMATACSNIRKLCTLPTSCICVHCRLSQKRGRKESTP